MEGGKSGRFVSGGCFDLEFGSGGWLVTRLCLRPQGQGSGRHEGEQRQRRLGLQSLFGSTILQKSNLHCGGKSSDIMLFGNIEQGLGLALVASQEPVW